MLMGGLKLTAFCTKPARRVMVRVNRVVLRVDGQTANAQRARELR
jgi:hypothetical protein